MSQLLNEMTVARPKIVESNKAKLPEGVLLRVSYPICNIDERNHNNRIYRKSVWEKVINDTDVREKMERRCLFGHAEHPETTQSNLEKTSHIITKMWIDEGTNKVYQQFDVLDTPYGRIIETLFRAGCQVGCSTRAEGDLKEAEDDKGKYMEVIAESYAYVTTDYTADPSTYKSIPEDVEMNMVETIEKGFGEKKMDKEYAVHMLEGMKSKKAVALLESIKKDVSEDASVNEDIKPEGGKTEENITVDTDDAKIKVDGQDVNVQVKEPEEEPALEVTIEEPAPEVPAEPTPDVPAPTEEPKGVPEEGEPEEPEIEVEGELDMEDLPFENKKEKTGKVVFENYQAMVKFLEQAFSKVNGKLSKDLKLSEGIEPSETKKQITALNISLAETKAESEKASDLLKETSEKLTKLEESSKKDAAALTEAKKQLTEKDEKISILEGKNKKIEEKLSVLTPQIVKVEEASKDFDAKIKAMKEAHQKELIHKYVHTRIESTGLHVPPSTLTLLENCQTEEEADKLFTAFMRNITESTLHSSVFGKPSDQNKESKVVRNPEDDAIRSRVQENFRAMNKGF